MFIGKCSRLSRGTGQVRRGGARRDKVGAVLFEDLKTDKIILQCTLKCFL